MSRDERTETIATRLRVNGFTGEPSDEWAIRDLEHQLGITLPAAYRAFLLIAGNGFKPWEGSHYTIDEAAEMQRWTRELPAKQGQSLPCDSFAFLCHQGAAIAFFLLEDGDDPAVFEWVSCEFPQPVEQAAHSFSAYLEKSREWG